MKTFLACTALALASATSALASGPVAPPPPHITPIVPVPVLHDWTGAYIGLRVGTPLGSNYWAERSVDARSTAEDWSGTTYGISAGYDVQSGNWVFGGALDYMAGDIHAASTTNPAFGCVGGTCDTMVENSLALRARVGWAMDRTLLYATAGFATGDVVARNGAGPILGEDRLNGWTAGLGLEFAVSRSLSLTLEYLHTDLGRLEIPTACGVDCFTDVEYGTFRIGANFRF